MIEISTTATFDRLFKKLPSTIQRKAVIKTDLFTSNPFHLDLIQKFEIAVTTYSCRFEVR